jgi:hypothetical protein
MDGARIISASAEPPCTTHLNTRRASRWTTLQPTQRKRMEEKPVCSICLSVLLPWAREEVLDVRRRPARDESEAEEEVAEEEAWGGGKALDTSVEGTDKKVEALATASITTLHCSHTFHTPCIARWAQTSDLCPNCKRSIHRPPVLIEHAKATMEACVGCKPCVEVMERHWRALYQQQVDRANGLNARIQRMHKEAEAAKARKKKKKRLRSLGIMGRRPRRRRSRSRSRTKRKRSVTRFRRR